MTFKRKVGGFSLATALLLLLLVARSAGAAGAPLQGERTGQFQEVDCWFNAGAGAVSPAETRRRATCGDVTVPESYSEPDGPLIRLAVAILESPDPSAPPDPLFLVQGGPGGSGIDFFAELILNGAILQGLERDLVIVEQRGTLFSSPDLLCLEEEVAMTEETLEAEMSPEEELAATLETYRACRQRLVAEGIDLDDYDTFENAADMEMVRQALGYEQINFYGVSYGTMLAQQLMRFFPDGLRSVILDGVVAPNSPFVEDALFGADRAFDLLFATCADDAGCSDAYPNLEERFYDLVGRLNEEPTEITLTDLYTSRQYDVPFDGDDLLDTFFLMFYDSSLLPGLPLAVGSAEEGEFDLLELTLSLQVFDRTVASGMYYSVICSEIGEITLDVPADETVHPALRATHRRDLEHMAAVCEMWDVEPLPPLVREPVTSDVPTLLLSGEFDPITPPQNATMVAQGLSRNTVFTAPFTGHGAAVVDDCALQVMEAFLDDPLAPPLPACADAPVAEATFVTNEDIVETDFNKWLSYLFIALSEDDFAVGPFLAGPLIYLLAATVLSSSLLIWPAAWLAGRARRERAADGGTGGGWLRLTGGALATVNASLVFLFSLGLLWAVGDALANSIDLVTFGLPAAYAPLFLLPPLIVLLTGAMLFTMAVAWGQGRWSWPRRLYYLVLVLAAGALSAILINLDFVTALLRR